MKSYLAAGIGICLLLGMAGCQTPSAPPAVLHFKVVDLGTLPGDNESHGLGLNELGYVVGFSESGQTGSGRGFVWFNGQMFELATLPGGGDESARGINANLNVIGKARSSNGEYHAVVWDFNPNGSSTIHDLGVLANGRDSEGFGTSPRGWRFVGGSTTSGLNFTNGFVRNGNPALNPPLVDVGTFPGGSDSVARAVNSRGLVVGWSATSSGLHHAFLRAGGVLRDIGTPGGSFSEAHGISENGSVTGYALSDTGFFHAFLWRNAFVWHLGTMKDLGPFPGPGGKGSLGLGVNDWSWVVGWGATAANANHAIIWTKASHMRDLNDLIDPNAGWVLERANAVNNKGQIVGTGMHNGARHAFLLNPVE